MADKYLADVPPPVITRNTFTYKDHEELENVEGIVEEIRVFEKRLEETLKNMNAEELEEKRIKLFELYDKALEYLANVLQARSEQYGDFAYENGDLAYQYGDLLLRRGKEQNNMITFSKLQKSLEQKIKEEEESNPLSNASSSTHVFAEDQQEEAEEVNEDSELIQEESVDEILENAWQSLELSRVIFKKHLEEKVASAKDRRYVQGKLADVYMSLADLERENENFTQAIEDYQNALELFAPDEYKKIASLHTELAITLMFQKKYDKALEYYKKAAEVLECHINNCKNDVGVTSQILTDLCLRIDEMQQEQKEKAAAEQEGQKKQAQLEQQQKLVERSNKVNVLIPKHKPKPTENASTNSISESNKRKREDDNQVEDENEKKKLKLDH